MQDGKWSMFFEEKVGELSRQIAESKGTQLTLASLVQLIGEKLNCEWVAYWKFNRLTYVLNASAIWSKDPCSTDMLLKHTEKKRFWKKRRQSRFGMEESASNLDQ